ncbi:MAG: tRNA (N(6)-L-threonylcarbamoyladenosine(37)-C(2))-methylthiotransferase MtaB [Planctomycetes bacterium]|nr:tRNA (N(6)-L-threonylcarbamoyladenosine(37)-C(2))-methylthiotransferase MtaB [Planctomycetota bacterium]
MPTLKTVTLGCKVNQYETEYVRQGLVRAGYREAVDGEEADLCVVNTCTVTIEGDRKSRQAIRQLSRQNPHAEIVVMGCYATRAAEEVAQLPGVAQVVTDKARLPDLLARFGLTDVPSGISTFGSRHRAYVKVQDGCRMQCAYCIIPTVRPELVSRPADDVLAEIGRLVESGHREIVLTGIHLGHYGVDRASDDGHANLAGLVRKIAALEGEFRLRLSSLEAAEVTPDLLAALADRPDRICPHLHLSMQSGSDAVLRRMRRRTTAGQFVEHCRQIGRVLDRPALTTDVIVGFPGETDADFADTCRVTEEVGFSKIHVFRFSRRPGTAAAEMPDQLPGKLKQERAAHLAEIGQRLRASFFESLCGDRIQVLVESAVVGRPGYLWGTSGRYVPAELLGTTGQIGRLVEAVALRLAGDRLVCEAG